MNIYEIFDGIRAIEEAELQEAVAGKVVYHGTSSNLLNRILDEGIRGPSNWGNRKIAESYAKERAKETGSTPIVVEKQLEEFSTARLRPDLNAVELHPLFLYMDDDELDEMADKWEYSNKTWKDSLEIFGCLLYGRDMPVSEEDIHALGKRL